MCAMEKMESTAGGVGMFVEHAVLTKSSGLWLGLRKMGMESLKKEIIGGERRREKVRDGW
jgi:hypothetical protein